MTPARLLSAMTALLVLIALAPAAASAAERSVETSGADSGDCIELACATIQYAVDQAGPGDVLLVGAGTFAGGVTIAETGVTIQGRSAEETIVTGASGAGVFVVADGADGTSLTDMTIGGGTNGVFTDGGVDTLGLTRVRIEANTAAGVEIHNSAVVSGLSIDSSTVTGNATGLRLRGEASNTCICASHFDGNGIGIASVTSEADPAVVDGLSVFDSTFNENTLKGMYFEALSGGYFDSIEVVGSGTEGASPAGIDVNLKYADFQQVYFFDSKVSGSTGTGIWVKGRNDGPYAASPASVTDVVLAGVTVTGNDRGVAVGNDVRQIQVLGGRIVGNATAGLLSAADPDAGTIDASETWWGCNAGPGGSGCDDVVIEPGAAAVDADPWLVLDIASDRSEIAVGGDHAVISATISRNSDGGEALAGVAGPTPVAFATDLGTVDPLDGELCGCLGADTTLTSGTTRGIAYVTATVDNETVEVPVTILAGRLTLTPDSIDFGDQPIKTASTPMTVVVQNTGTQAVGVNRIWTGGADRSSYVLSNDTCATVTLGPGETCTIDVAFRPQATGAKSAALLVVNDGQPNPAMSELSGAGVQGVPQITPGDEGYGDVTLGGAAASRTLTLTNTGSAPLTAKRSYLGGADRTSFVIANDDCAGRTLGTGETCTVDVDFRPRRIGPKVAQLRVLSNGLPSPATADLTGTGVLAEGEATPSPTSFGDQPRNTLSSVHVVTLTNTGTVPMRISRSYLGGTHRQNYVIVDDACAGQTIAPGLACAIEVAFRPSALGARAGQLRILANVPGGQLRADLTGAGT